jgi:hypothetical protein
VKAVLVIDEALERMGVENLLQRRRNQITL